jgi:hypothetical protein
MLEGHERFARETGVANGGIRDLETNVAMQRILICERVRSFDYPGRYSGMSLLRAITFHLAGNDTDPFDDPFTLLVACTLKHGRQGCM